MGQKDYLRGLLGLIEKVRKKKAAHLWTITYDRFKPAQEGLREALCALGNGYFGTRGSAPESPASRIHYPGTYIAGVYNKLATHIAGQTVLNENLVNCPNWISLTFRIGKDDWITLSPRRILSYHQQLEMRRGVLTRRIRHRDHRGQRTLSETQRIVHMAEPHRAAIRYIITPENYEGWIVIRTALDGTVQNTGVERYRQLNSRHLKPGSLGSFGRNGIYLSVKTSHSGIEIAEAAKTRIFSAGKEIRPTSRILTIERKGICQEFAIYVRKKNRYEIEKNVSVYTSRDKDVRNPVTAAVKSVKGSQRFKVMLKTHQHAWELLWKRFDLQIEGDAFAQRALRLHAFHLLQTASIHNSMLDAGLPARGLHGEAYRGHIFWDELFVLPFYSRHVPEISKALLLYRYRRLPKAREYARNNGYSGAMFPWQSGSTGEEETQVVHLNPMSGKWGPDYSHIQRHVSFAIAYNVWQFWKKTGDFDFINRYGAEIILSIAQFCSSLSKYDSGDGRYHTEGIMGPDEFHEKSPESPESGLKDNAYSNLMIAWTLLRAREVLDILAKYHKERILKRLRLSQKELERWKDITRKMKITIDENGVISQFDGYFGLKELDWNGYRAKYGKIQRMDRILKAEGKSPNDYKVAKQADVLMIFYLLSLSEVKDIFHSLGYRFDKNALRKNYDYYVKRTSHGSTLSKVVHCYVANLVGKPKDSWRLFEEVLESDIYDTQGGTTPEGIHAGVMGGSLNIAIRGFAGISVLDDRVKIEPCLPRSWRSVGLRVRYKGIWVSLYITKRQVTILARGPKARRFALPVEIYGSLHRLVSGKTHKFSLEKRS